MRYLHIAVENMPGQVSTVAIHNDGYVEFMDNDEYSIQDLKDIIAEAEYELDNALDNESDDEVDWELDELDEDYD